MSDEAERGDIIHYSDESTICTDWPDWLKRRQQWFMDLRFGIIIHWGIYSQWNCCESWPLVPKTTWARPDDLDCWVARGRNLECFSRDYRALNRTFNPTAFDPGAWAELIAAAGAKYACLTTKHHDGFCLWDTATTEYRTTHASCPYHTDPQADIVKHAFAAFRARDLAISCYFSKSDWHCPWYWCPEKPVVDRHPNYDTHEEPERWESFVRFVHSQVEELMSRYGKIDVLWLDGGQVRPPDQDIRMDQMVAMARRYQPELLVADRTVGGLHENIITPEQGIPNRPIALPWESCITLGGSWKYVENDAYKPVADVLQMLIESAAKGGNLLLGIGPDATGRMPPVVAERLRAIGAWLKTHGEGIYGTRPRAPYREGGVSYTQKAGVVYAFFNPEAARPALRLTGLADLAVRTVTALETGQPVEWKRADDGAIEVACPAGRADLPAGVALRLQEA